MCKQHTIYTTNTLFRGSTPIGFPTHLPRIRANSPPPLPPERPPRRGRRPRIPRSAPASQGPRPPDPPPVPRDGPIGSGRGGGIVSPAAGGGPAVPGTSQTTGIFDITVLRDRFLRRARQAKGNTGWHPRNQGNSTKPLGPTPCYLLTHPLLKRLLVGFPLKGTRVLVVAPISPEHEKYD